MKDSRCICILILFFFITGTIGAQELTDSIKKEMKLRVVQKVEEFQHALSNVVNNQLKHDIRKENVINLLKLFMGEGDPYDYYDEELDKRVHSTGVKMHTSSVYKTSIQSQKLKRYIYKLYDPETGKTNLPYTKIEIEAVDAIVPSEIYDTGNNKYECIAYCYKKGIYYKEGKAFYSEKSYNRIRCAISVITLPYGRLLYDVKLGDIYVNQL